MQLPDQADLLARLRQAEAQLPPLKAELDRVKAEYEASTALLLEAQDTIKRLELERDEAATRAKASQAAAEQATAAKVAAEAQLTDFNTRVASEVKRLGLARVPAPSPQNAVAEEKLTPTQKVLRAKGVNSLKDLE